MLKIIPERWPLSHLYIPRGLTRAFPWLYPRRKRPSIRLATICPLRSAKLFDTGTQIDRIRPTHSLHHRSTYTQTHQCRAVRISAGPTRVAVQYSLLGNSSFPVARPGQPFGSAKDRRSTHPYALSCRGVVGPAIFCGLWVMECKHAWGSHRPSAWVRVLACIHLSTYRARCGRWPRRRSMPGWTLAVPAPKGSAAAHCAAAAADPVVRRRPLLLVVCL